MEALKIVLIHCQVSSTIMIPRTRDEKFLHRGSVEKVLRHESVEDCADPLLGIKDHNDSLNNRGEVPTSWKFGRDPT